jgi:hypothetical protein
LKEGRKFVLSESPFLSRQPFWGYRQNQNEIASNHDEKAVNSIERREDVR